MTKKQLRKTRKLINKFLGSLQKSKKLYKNKRKRRLSKKKRKSIRK